VLQEQLKALKRARQAAKQAARNACKQERAAWKRRSRIVKVGSSVMCVRVAAHRQYDAGMHAATVFRGVVGMMRIQHAGCMCEAARQLSTEDLTELLRAKEARVCTGVKCLQCKLGARKWRASSKQSEFECALWTVRQVALVKALYTTEECLGVAQKCVWVPQLQAPQCSW